MIEEGKANKTIDPRKMYNDIEVPFKPKDLSRKGYFNDTGFNISKSINEGLTTFIEDLGLAEALAKSRGTYKFKVYSHRKSHSQHIMNERTIKSLKGTNHIGYGVPK